MEKKQYKKIKQRCLIMRADRVRRASMPPVYSESEASTKWRAMTGGVSEHLTNPKRLDFKRTFREKL